jgi:hypothetical protein
MVSNGIGEELDVEVGATTRLDAGEQRRRCARSSD